jgi:hypothetical protein
MIGMNVSPDHGLHEVEACDVKVEPCLRSGSQLPLAKARKS